MFIPEYYSGKDCLANMARCFVGNLNLLDIVQLSGGTELETNDDTVAVAGQDWFQHLGDIAL